MAGQNKRKDQKASKKEVGDGSPGPNRSVEKARQTADSDSESDVEMGVVGSHGKKGLQIASDKVIPTSQRFLKKDGKLIPPEEGPRGEKRKPVSTDEGTGELELVRFREEAALYRDEAAQRIVHTQGRPPTSGNYMKLANAKERCVRAERAKLEWRLERELLELGIRPPISKPYAKRTKMDYDKAIEKARYQPSVDLRASILEGMTVVEDLARISNNLKGTTQKALRLAAIKATAAVGALAEREEDNPSKEEKAALEKEVSDLRQQVGRLNETIRSLNQTSRVVPLPSSASEEGSIGSRLHVTGKRKGTTAAPPVDKPPSLSTRGVKHDYAESSDVDTPNLEDRMMARLEGLVSSKLEQLLGVTQTPSTAEKTAVYHSRPPTPLLSPSVPAVRAESPMRGDPSSSSQPKASTWAEVAKKGKIKKVSTPNTSAKAKQRVIADSVKGAKTGTSKSTKVQKNAVPQYAAVVVTAYDGNYAQALLKARQAIPPETNGTEEIRAKRSLTGGYLFEFLGTNGQQRADAFAEKLQQVFGNDEESNVKVTRPNKKIEIRIRKIMDSFLEKDVVDAICRVTGCRPAEIDTGEIQRASDDLGMLWVRLPERAGETLLENGLGTSGWRVLTMTVVSCAIGAALVNTRRRIARPRFLV